MSQPLCFNTALKVFLFLNLIVRSDAVEEVIPLSFTSLVVLELSFQYKPDTNEKFQLVYIII